MGSRIYYETHYAPLLQHAGLRQRDRAGGAQPERARRPVVASARQVRDDAGQPALVHVALFDSTDRRSYERELLQERKRAEQASRAAGRRGPAQERVHRDAGARAPQPARRRSGGHRDCSAASRRSTARLGKVADAHASPGRSDGAARRRSCSTSAASARTSSSIQQGRVDLASVVAAGHRGECSRAAAGAGADRSRPPESPIYAEADAARIAQVIGNLLNNAAKFTPARRRGALTLTRDGDDAVIRDPRHRHRHRAGRSCRDLRHVHAGAERAWDGRAASGSA